MVRPAGAGWSEALQCVDLRRLEKEWRPLSLAHAWDDAEDIAFVSQRPFPEYQQVLDDGHREFVRLHQEQLRLINDGFFVKTLASAVARMGNVASLLMGDRMAAKTKHPPTWLSDLDTLGVSPAELLTRFISHPITWREIASKAEGPTELPTARLLWELPIALREAGAPPLRELHLHVVPRYGNFATLSPAAYYPPERAAATWGQLSAACEALEIFAFRPSICYQQTPNDDKVHLDRYLTAAMARCGQRSLRHFDLDFLQEEIDVWRLRTMARRRFYPAIALARGLPALPRVRDLRLRGLELRQADIEDLVCNKIGGCLATLKITNMMLRGGGTWAGTLDGIQPRLAARGGSLEVWFSRLRGGGVEGDWDGDGPVVELPVTLPLSGSRWPEGGERSAEASVLAADIARYVLGFTEENPLRDGRGGDGGIN